MNPGAFPTSEIKFPKPWMGSQWPVAGRHDTSLFKGRGALTARLVRSSGFKTKLRAVDSMRGWLSGREIRYQAIRRSISWERARPRSLSWA